MSKLQKKIFWPTSNRGQLPFLEGENYLKSSKIDDFRGRHDGGGQGSEPQVGLGLGFKKNRDYLTWFRTLMTGSKL